MTNKNWIDKLRARKKETGSIVCVGVDPVLDKIPGREIYPFYMRLLQVMATEEVQVSTFKPNLGFFEAASNGDPKSGHGKLRAIRDAYQGQGLLYLLDAKRGDIGSPDPEKKKTADFYAQADFINKGAEALTINPYAGWDCVGAFTKYCNPEMEGNQDNGGRGVYALCRTSNPGAQDIQDLVVEDGRPVYMHVAEKIAGEWYMPGLGAVIGATGVDELAAILKVFKDSGKDIPLLIPGVTPPGSVGQGASAADVVDTLRAAEYPLELVDINVSSGVSQAWTKTWQGPGEPPLDYCAHAGVEAIQRLEEQISPIQ